MKRDETANLFQGGYFQDFNAKNMIAETLWKHPMGTRRVSRPKMRRIKVLPAVEEWGLNEGQEREKIKREAKKKKKVEKREG